MDFWKLRMLLGEVKDSRFVSVPSAIRSYWCTRKTQAIRLRWPDLRERAISDVLYVICSGPSLNKLEDEHWRRIEEGDSIGINFSYLTGRPSTYHVFSFERDGVLVDRLRATVRNYPYLSRSTILIPWKAVGRFAHPRLIPEIFPHETKYVVFDLPSVIELDSNREFEDRDFDRSLFYRGTMTLAIELGVNVLGYRKIVLVGSDLCTSKHFFDDLPVMREVVCERSYTGVMEGMIPKGNKYRTLAEYVCALREYLLRKRGVELCVAFPNDLYPDVPVEFC